MFEHAPASFVCKRTRSRSVDDRVQKLGQAISWQVTQSLRRQITCFYVVHIFLSSNASLPQPEPCLPFLYAHKYWQRPAQQSPSAWHRYTSPVHYRSSPSYHRSDSAAGYRPERRDTCAKYLTFSNSGISMAGGADFNASVVDSPAA